LRGDASERAGVHSEPGIGPVGGEKKFEGILVSITGGVRAPRIRQRKGKKRIVKKKLGKKELFGLNEGIEPCGKGE